MTLATRDPTIPTNTSGATDDLALLEVWLATKASINTRRAYAYDVTRFLAFVDKPLARVCVAELLAFTETVPGSPATKARALGSVRSLLTFGARTGYLPYNVGAAVRPPYVQDRLAKRILAEEDVQRMLAMAPPGRDATIVRLLYSSGIRVSELCGLRWGDTRPQGDAGSITVTGKGGRTRTILLSERAWREVASMRGEAAEDAAVFTSRTGKPLDRTAVFRVVQRVAKRAGARPEVSPHWLRHAHASHALDRGAPVHLVAATLGHASLSTTSRYTHARPKDSSALYIMA